MQCEILQAARAVRANARDPDFEHLCAVANTLWYLDKLTGEERDRGYAGFHRSLETFFTNSAREAGDTAGSAAGDIGSSAAIPVPPSDDDKERKEERDRAMTEAIHRIKARLTKRRTVRKPGRARLRHSARLARAPSPGCKGDRVIDAIKGEFA